MDWSKIFKGPKNQMHDHWLVRPGTVRGIWAISLGVLVGTVLADLSIDHNPKFGIDGSFGFAAWFGFAACVALVLLSKLLGLLLKRPDDYYDD
ncbi:MAG: hypothetical protein AAF713_17275 [Pseudomonadota bacterium]